MNLYIEAMQSESFSGVYNATAPNPVRMSELCSSLGSVLGRPSWLPVPDFALQVRTSPCSSLCFVLRACTFCTSICCPFYALALKPHAIGFGAVHAPWQQHSHLASVVSQS